MFITQRNSSGKIPTRHVGGRRRKSATRNNILNINACCVRYWLELMGYFLWLLYFLSGFIRHRLLAAGHAGEGLKRRKTISIKHTITIRADSTAAAAADYAFHRAVHLNYSNKNTRSASPPLSLRLLHTSASLGFLLLLLLFDLEMKHETYTRRRKWLAAIREKEEEEKKTCCVGARAPRFKRCCVVPPLIGVTYSSYIVNSLNKHLVRNTSHVEGVFTDRFFSPIRSSSFQNLKSFLF